MALPGFCLTLYHVAVKASFYRKAVEVYFIPSPTTKLDFVPEVLGHIESFLMRLGELLPGSRVGYLRWTPLSYVDVSESDDTVSEHEGLVSLSTIVSSGAGVVLFLGEEGSEKELGSPWKGRSKLLCRRHHQNYAEQLKERMAMAYKELGKQAAKKGQKYKKYSDDYADVWKQ